MLLSVGTITGRQLECKYSFGSWYLGPTFNHCFLSRVDFSESFRTENHSFTGSASEKSKVTVIWFTHLSKIDFLPKEFPIEFPNLNGLKFVDCNLPVLKNDLFSEDFRGLEYLNFQWSQIESIEPFAFQHLKNLEWFSVHGNKIQSLPFNLFQNNPKLFYVDFEENEIDSISPNLFKNLNQLISVNFRYSRCVNYFINKVFACDTCPQSISQSDLDSLLGTCYQNCLKDPDCARKSEIVEGTIQTTSQVTTTQPSVKEEDLPDSPAQNNTSANPNPTPQFLQTNLTQELAKNISEQLKSTEEKLEEKTATLNQDLQVQQENLPSLNQSVASEVTKAVSSYVEKMEMKVEILSLKFSELKARLELERKDRELVQSKCENDKLARDIEIAKLKQEIKDWKKEARDREITLKLEFNEIISKKLAEFELKFKNQTRL
jgi:hypothetical protein